MKILCPVVVGRVVVGVVAAVVVIIILFNLKNGDGQSEDNNVGYLDNLPQLGVPFCLAVVNLTTFYEQFLRKYSFVKELQSQTVIREKLGITLAQHIPKNCLEMLVKLTPGK